MPSPESGGETTTSELRTRLGELADLQRVGQLLGWDQQTMMPPAGAEARGEAMSTVQRLAHDRLVDPRLATLLASAGDSEDPGVVRAVRRDHERARRVPTDLAAEIVRAGSDGFMVWLEAREADDFAQFLPALERNLELARRLAGCFEDSEHPYDALLDQYEPGATTAQVSALFARLRDGLVPLLADIARQPEPAGLPGAFPIAGQREIGMEIARAMGFDESSWRVDDAVHPFASATAPSDVRVTARWDERDLQGIFALMHEVGHGLYEHGVDPALARTTVDTGVSLGVHESQSRLWENLVGRSEPFWRHWLPRMRERFPLTLRDTSLEQFLRAINVVRPSLIRVEADEVTYSLHVILRFELEVALIEGSLAARDLPAAWAAGMRRLLGIEVPDDRSGVLQDIHWSEGIIGYFPTYAIGNMLAAQLWDVARTDVPSLDDDIAAGDYGRLREWLGAKIHRHGRRLPPPELVQQAVGGPLDPEPLLRQLRAKYGALYGLG